MANITFRQRLTRAVTTLCLGLLLMAGIAVFIGAKVALDRNRDQALLAIAEAELASSVDGPNGTVHVHEDGPKTLALLSGPGYEKFAMIYDYDGHLVAHTANGLHGLQPLENAVAVSEAKRGHPVFTNLPHGEDGVRALYYPLTDRHGAKFFSVCAIPEAPLKRALTTFSLVIAATVIVAGLLVSFLARAMARSLTHPLEVIARQAHRIEERNLSERINSVSPDTELVMVSDALNGMLSRLEAAFNAQRQFVMNASHELRSPLSNLRGTIEVTLRRPRSCEEYRETLQVALAETERLSRLATDLLLLSRAESGQLSLNFSPCNLAEVATQSICHHQASATERGVVIVARTVPGVIWGDVDRLRQVFDNLLDNALRYAPDGSTITVIVGTEENHCFVRVEDQGAGIGAEHLPHIFDRFYRADPSRARGSGGVGLGLTIVKAIVEAHQGGISVESDGKTGTRFLLSFPLHNAPDGSETRPLTLP